MKYQTECLRVSLLCLQPCDGTGLNDYDLFRGKATDLSRAQPVGAALALHKGDNLNLAHGLLAWSKERGKDQLDWLRDSVAPVARRVLEACQGQVLGCAWRGGGQSDSTPDLHCRNACFHQLYNYTDYTIIINYICI